MASLTTPVVGRMDGLAGTFRRLPLASPATMRITDCASGAGRRLDYCTATSIVPEKRVFSAGPGSGAGETEKLVR